MRKNGTHLFLHVMPISLYLPYINFIFHSANITDKNDTSNSDDPFSEFVRIYPAI